MSDCIVHKGYRTTKMGYGMKRHKGKMWMAHRLSYHLHTGVDVTGKMVLHKCDNPPCINPEHLYLGDATDNMRDRSARGRARNGNTDKNKCVNGHTFTKKNTHLRPDGSRQCRICIRAASIRTNSKQASLRAHYKFVMEAFWDFKNQYIDHKNCGEKDKAILAVEKLISIIPDDSWIKMTGSYRAHTKKMRVR